MMWEVADTPGPFVMKKRARAASGKFSRSMSDFKLGDKRR